MLSELVKANRTTTLSPADGFCATPVTVVDFTPVVPKFIERLRLACLTYTTRTYSAYVQSYPCDIRIGCINI